MKQKKAVCTIVIVAVNIIIFLYLSLFGMTEDSRYMLQHGALYIPVVFQNGEYYRLITSMFLHFGFSHLANNMVMLFLMGWILEKEIGSVRFVLIYFLSGLGGDLLYILYSIRMDEYAVSAGASGAIFGIVGALLYIAIRNRGHIGNITGRGIIFMIFCSLYYGYSSTGVNNLAHIGGLCTGFLVAILLYRKRNLESGSLM